MSVIIRGMEMPKDGCMDCKLCRYMGIVKGTRCCITMEVVEGNHERGGFPTKCPLSDLDAVMEEMKRRLMNT